jgi:hypothetical protein
MQDFSWSYSKPADRSLAGHKSLQNETPKEPKTPPAEVWLGTCLVAEQFSHDVTAGTGMVDLLV